MVNKTIDFKNIMNLYVMEDYKPTTPVNCMLKNQYLNGVIYDKIYKARYIENMKQWFLIDIKTGPMTTGKYFDGDDLIFIGNINNIVDEL